MRQRLNNTHRSFPPRETTSHICGHHDLEITGPIEPRPLSHRVTQERPATLSCLAEQDIEDGFWGFEGFSSPLLLSLEANYALTFTARGLTA